MRTQQIMTVLQDSLDLDLVRTEHFETNAHFRGGWEVWLQCEIAMAFFNNATSQSFEREVPYPSGNALLPYLSYNNATHAVAEVANPSARADFKVERLAGAADTTFLELKCQKSTETVGQAWSRLEDDVYKIDALAAANNTLNCTALLASWGIFTAEEMRNLNWCWTNRSSYVLDYSQNPPLLTSLQNVALDGNDRQFIIGISQTL